MLAQVPTWTDFVAAADETRRALGHRISMPPQSIEFCPNDVSVKFIAVPPNKIYAPSNILPDNLSKFITQARDSRIDGLRGLAIILVVCQHVRVSCGISAPIWFPFDGLFGVCLFFVVSGYIITTLLCNEFDQRGGISLWRFYGRRAIRIFPAFYFFITCMVLARASGWVNFDLRGLLASIFYLRNILPTNDSVLQHTWSLAVEEQFYVVWPVCMALLPRRVWPLLVALGLAAKPVLKVILSRGYLNGAIAINSASFDAVFLGVALALWLDGPGRKWHSRESAAKWTRFDFVPIFCLVSLFVLYHEAALVVGWPTVLVPFMRNALVGLLLFYFLGRTGGIANAILTSNLFVWFGLVSYSLYLWQQPFLVGDINSWGGVFQRFVLFAIFSLFSYFCVERSALRLKPLFRVK